MRSPLWRKAPDVLFYRTVLLLLYLPLRLGLRLRFLHRDRVPTAGGFILSGNHVSHLDPVLLALFSWRTVSYMGKAELFEGARWFAAVLRLLDVFPVRRGKPDRQALAAASHRLQAGKIVGIFPEGRRAGGDDPGKPYGGAAMLALRTGVPVLPVGISGTDRALPRGARRLRLVPVTIAFGEPLRAEDVPGESRRERVDALTAILMERIGSAVDEARGR